MEAITLCFWNHLTELYHCTEHMLPLSLPLLPWQGSHYQHKRTMIGWKLGNASSSAVSEWGEREELR